jgi:hypothetical protein
MSEATSGSSTRNTPDFAALIRATRSRFFRALFQFSKRAAGETAEFSRSGVELLLVIGAARLEGGEPAAEAGELIRRQLGNSFGDFFDFHVPQYSTAAAWLNEGNGLGARRSVMLLQQERAGVEIAVDPERLRAALAPAVPNDGVKGA